MWATPQTHTHKPNKKEIPMDYNNVNRWYNIEIIPIWDYINHGTTITIYQQ